MKHLVAILLSVCGLANASQDAAILDTATTLSAIAIGASEANPVGLLAIPLKVAAIAHADSLPEGDRQAQHLMLSTLWRGAAINNLCVMASVVTGGSFAPACLIAGVVSVVKDYLTTEEQRAFWAICSSKRALNPRLKCAYTTPT